MFNHNFTITKSSQQKSRLYIVNRTVLQDVIINIFKRTSDFPNVSNIDLNKIFHDGHVISKENKKLIDDCLEKYPETLFKRGENSPLKCCFQTSFRGYEVTVNALTSVMIYLIEQGAGIGDDTAFQIIELDKISSQLFVGVDCSKFMGHGLKGILTHVFKGKDIIDLYNKKDLLDKDISRLQMQAKNALKYGNFDSKIKNNLNKNSCFLELVPLFTKRQFSAYLEYKGEIKIIVLQALHQLAERNFPQEMLIDILTYLTGLNKKEVTDMSNAIISRHEKEFPAYQSRRLKLVNNC